MESTINRAASRIAEHKLLIIEQQQLAAAFARTRDSNRARRERTKLFRLLHEVDLMEAQRVA
jgi:hypothetical protein